MSWNLRSNEKRIRELEKKVGITYDPVKINYWQELNNYASKVFLKEYRKKCNLRYSFTLPEHLKFAKKVFLRLVEFYRKLYQRVLSEKPKITSYRKIFFKDIGWVEFPSCNKIKIPGFGAVMDSEYNHIKLACIIRALSIKDEVKKFLLDSMSGYVLRVSGRIAELGLCV